LSNPFLDSIFIISNFAMSTTLGYRVLGRECKSLPEIKNWRDEMLVKILKVIQEGSKKKKM